MGIDIRTLTVFAAEGTAPGGEGGREAWRYYSLGDGKRVNLTDAEAAVSTAWHLAFKRSLIRVNGGVAGSAGIVGGCLLGPVEVGRDEFLKLTDADFIARFESVTAIPDDATLTGERIEPALFGWRVKEGGVYAAPVGKGWKVRCADGTSFARMRVTDVAADGSAFTLRYAFQPEKGGALGDDKKATVAAGEGFRFRDGATPPRGFDHTGLDWDIRFDAATDEVYCNSSVSGPGQAGVLGSNKYGAKWSELTDPSDCIVFFVDEYGALFRSPKWYRYNIDGNHNLHPNGAVYGLRAPDGDYTVQVYDYFEHKGSDVGNFRLRYARL